MSWVALLACALASVLVHARSVMFDFTRTDDKVLLADDATFLGDLGNAGKVLSRPFFPSSSVGEAYYRPLVTWTFMVDTQWAGVVPAAYHATNVVLHGVATGLLFLLLGRLGHGPALAGFGAGLFGVHPALTEAVAWIPGRCDLLLGIGFLVAALGLVRMAHHQPGLGLHLAGLVTALLSKEAGVVIPAVMAGMLVAIPGGRAVVRRIGLWVGWLAVLVGWFLLRSSVVGAQEPGLGERVETLFERLPMLLTHIGKLLHPRGLAVLAYAGDTSWVAGAVAAAALAGVGVWSRGPRLYLWGLGALAAFLLPTLPVSDFLILENRLYVPAACLVVALSAAVANGIARRPAAGRVLAVAGAVVFVTFSALTVHYSESFRNPAAFTEAAVRTSPHLGLAHLNRGIVLQLDGRTGEAEGEYARAIQLDPDLGVTHNNLGLLHMERGDLAGAERLFRRELELNPGYDKAYFNLGLALARQGRVAEAAISWREALRLDSTNQDARTNLDQAQAMMGGVGTSPMRPVDADSLPADVLQRLYESALQRQPENEAIRRAYRELCRRRDLDCRP